MMRVCVFSRGVRGLYKSSVRAHAPFVYVGAVFVCGWLVDEMTSPGLSHPHGHAVVQGEKSTYMQHPSPFLPSSSTPSPSSNPPGRRRDWLLVFLRHSDRCEHRLCHGHRAAHLAQSKVDTTREGGEGADRSSHRHRYERRKNQGVLVCNAFRCPKS